MKKTTKLGWLALAMMATLATQSPSADAAPPDRATIVFRARAALDEAIRRNAQARQNWNAALLERFRGGSLEALEVERMISKSWVNRAYGDALDARIGAAAVGEWALVGQVDRVILEIVATSREIGSFIRQVSFRPDGFGSYVTDENLNVQTFAGSGFVTIGWPDGTHITNYENGATSVKASPNGNTLHITESGMCTYGCQLVGANVIFFSKDSTGTLGEYISLPYDPIDNWTQEMMRQDAMMNQSLP